MTRTLFAAIYPRTIRKPQKLYVALEFKPQDLWIGAYWQTFDERAVDVWVCLVPMLPVHVRYHYGAA
jgi:hypothetical protein